MESPTEQRKRVLIVAQDFPWPAVSGALQRLGAVIDTLTEIGDVDLFSVIHPDRADPCRLPSASGVVRSTESAYTQHPLTPVRRLRWVTSGGPLQLAMADFSVPQASFAEWARPTYDLVWFSRAQAYVGLGRPDLGPTIVDLDDLEDHKILARLSIPPAAATDRRAAVVAELARRQALLDVRKWRRLQQSISSSVDAVVVCSRDDEQRLGVPNATVVPNGYAAPAVPAGNEHLAGAPTVLFAGYLIYAANIDAARWLAEEVTPLLRQLVPDVAVRLVGTPVPAVDAVHDPPSVTVVGRVPEMEPELRRADVVAVPVRFGSGTRIKILEAFAHRIPVVSTRLGAEGLPVEDGQHLLLADSAADFAAACARLLGDPELRARLVDAGQRLYQEQYQWAAGQAKIRELADGLIPLVPVDR